MSTIETVRNNIDEDLAYRVINEPQIQNQFEIYVQEDSVTISYRRTVYSILGYKPELGELFAKHKGNLDSEYPEEQTYYSLVEGAEQAFINAFENIIREKNAGLLAGKNVSFYADIPDSGDIDELELSIVFRDEEILDMEIDKFDLFAWDFVATILNMDDAGTFNHPYLYGDVARLMEEVTA